MNERILEQLENVPCLFDNAQIELERRAKEYAEKNNLSEQEKQRIRYELDKVKDWGIAKVFLFGFLLKEHSEGITISVENNCYLNYMVGLSPINPITYDLPLERFYNDKRPGLPIFNIYVKKGQKAKLLKRLYERFGVSCFCTGHDNSNVYYMSSKPIKDYIIKQRVIVSKIGEETYRENISILSQYELEKLGYYSFGIIEVKDFRIVEKKKFSAKEIYNKLKEDFYYKMMTFTSIKDFDEIKDILKESQNKLVYQKQVIDILSRVYNCSLEEADYYRREFAKGFRYKLKDIRDFLIEKYPDKGEKFFYYLYNNVRHTVSKAFLISKLQTEIDWIEEE